MYFCMCKAWASIWRNDLRHPMAKVELSIDLFRSKSHDPRVLSCEYFVNIPTSFPASSPISKSNGCWWCSIGNSKIKTEKIKPFFLKYFYISLIWNHHQPTTFIWIRIWRFLLILVIFSNFVNYQFISNFQCEFIKVFS